MYRFIVKPEEANTYIKDFENSVWNIVKAQMLVALIYTNTAIHVYF